MVKLFLASFEWVQRYGTTITRLRAKTQRGAALEVAKMQGNKSGPKVPEGYTVVDAAQLEAWRDEIETALGKHASACWVVDDVLTVKKGMSRAEAEEWLESNSKYIQEAMIQAGWNVIETL